MGEEKVLIPKVRGSGRRGLGRWGGATKKSGLESETFGFGAGVRGE